MLSSEESQAKADIIKKTIRQEDQRLRAKYTWLQYQDVIGTILVIGPLISMYWTSMAFINGYIPWYVASILMGLFISILHEMEHDLIHDQYFKHVKWVQDIMFYTIWVIKLNANPWMRRKLHLLHHRISGQINDIEERLIGLGLPFGFLRLGIAINPFISAIIFHGMKGELEKENKKIMYAFSSKSFAVLALHEFIFCGFIFGFIFRYPYFSNEFWTSMYNLFVLFILSNIIRQACLILISSYCHYFQDIPDGDVFYQNQILNHWSLWPLQAFCFNFGATHIIHHYVPNQPFYLRQMSADVVLKECIKQGVRVNDFGIIARANRFNSKSTRQ